MNSQQIECFLCVVKHMNFTKAAEELCLSQPTISRSISLLEDEFGFPLFNRSNKVVELTPGGVIMHNELSRVRQWVAESVRRGQRALRGVEGTLAIGCLTGTNTNMFVVPPTSLFSARYPNIEIVLDKVSFSTLRKKLASREFDVIFTLDFEKLAMEDTLSKDIYPLTSGILLSRKHPLADNPYLSIPDLQDETFLVPDQDESYGRKQDMVDLLRRFGLRDVKVKTVPNMESVILNVQLNKGISITDTSFEWVDHRQYLFLPLQQDKAPLHMIAVYNQDIANPIIPLYLEIWDHYEQIDVFQY